MAYFPTSCTHPSRGITRDLRPGHHRGGAIPVNSKNDNQEDYGSCWKEETEAPVAAAAWEYAFSDDPTAIAEPLPEKPHVVQPLTPQHATTHKKPGNGNWQPVMGRVAA